MVVPHTSQLLVCHQKIGGYTVDGIESAKRASWCDLAAHAWCFDCGFYVCDIHSEARHTRHRKQLVEDEAAHPADR